jgi:hypothetical protein
MRPPVMLVVALVLAVGQVRAQEPSGTAPLTEAADPPSAGVPESPGLARPRPSLRSSLGRWRPISRWLSRTSAPQDQDLLPLPVAENPQRPAESIGGPAPPVPVPNPIESESAETAATAGEPAATPREPGAATAGGAQGESRGSEAISGKAGRRVPRLRFDRGRPAADPQPTVPALVSSVPLRRQADLPDRQDSPDLRLQQRRAARHARRPYGGHPGRKRAHLHADLR